MWLLPEVSSHAIGHSKSHGHLYFKGARSAILLCAQVGKVQDYCLTNVHPHCWGNWAHYKANSCHFIWAHILSLDPQNLEEIEMVSPTGGVLDGQVTT